ncbi:MAG TPA: aminotransferase class V-fold PLP-dependent enzyme, partial [Aggregatilineales bacterium]|nr:aminotransferase class V-fold PLP-dependent enzyme [Aggregatilineales bacterium]
MAVSTPITTGYNVQNLRDTQFPITKDTVYLNHAAVSPLPRRVFDEIQRANSILLNNAGNAYDGYLDPLLEVFKETVRSLIKARSASEIVPVVSTSLGLNLVAQAFPWRQGDTVILADGEFSSNVYPWLNLKERYGVEVRFLRDAPGLTLEALAQAADERTRLVAGSLVQFFSGHRTDLQAVGDYCSQHNIVFAVDAMQGAGHIPIDVQAAHIGILCAGGQKSLMGPPGQGFLYVRDDLAEQMKPTLVGPNAVQDYKHWLEYDVTPLPGAERFTMGTLNFSGIPGLLESIRFLSELGIAHIDRHTTALADYAIEALRERGYAIVTPKQPEQHSHIVTFRVTETEEAATALWQKLKAHNIFVSKHWNVHRIAHLRLSVHCYN